MQFSKSVLFAVIASAASLFSANSALALPMVQTFSVNGCPTATSLVEGSFTVSNPYSFCGPVQNGGLAADGLPSTTTITSNGFAFDALSIEVGGINSAIPGETETFIGDLLGGGTVTQSFSFPGGVNFVTANLVGFQNLRDLRANLGFVSVQNLTYTDSAAPEPGTIGLIGLGLTAAVVASRRKRARTAVDSI
ncbi:MAG: PEP-CTERM sorting domain-containing protein [Acidobacteriaceae bacterium]|nr:PEP-CTERM sorting domain-containing protein [Acidobacteriaceae bacterium]